MYKILIDNKLIDFNLISEEDYNNSKVLSKNKTFIYGWFLVKSDNILIPKYIGQTTTGKKRWQQERTYDGCIILNKGIKKHKDKLKPFIITFANIESLTKLEQYYYDFFKTACSLGGYNIKIPELNRQEEPEIVKCIKIDLKNKLSIQDILKKYNISVASIREINRGRIWFNQKENYPLNKDITIAGHSNFIIKKNHLVCYYNKDGDLEKTFNTISEAFAYTNIGRATIHSMIKNNYGYFRYFEKDKIQKHIKIIKKKYPTISVLQYTKNGEYLNTYSSIKAAFIATGIKRETISNCLKNKDTSNCDGRFIWIINDENSIIKQKLAPSEIHIGKKISGKFGGFTLLQFYNDKCIATYKSINEAAKILKTDPHLLKKHAINGQSWHNFTFKLDK